MNCPHCHVPSEYNENVATHEDEEPTNGDRGICYGCGGWWILKNGTFEQYIPSKEELAIAYPELEPSRRRFKSRRT